MPQIENEIDTALAQEKLDKVLEALHSAPTSVVGLQTELIASAAESKAVRGILVRAGVCTEAGLLNLIAENVVSSIEEMVDAGILDEEALSFQTADEDEALGEV